MMGLNAMAGAVLLTTLGVASAQTQFANFPVKVCLPGHDTLPTQGGTGALLAPPVKMRF